MYRGSPEDSQNNDGAAYRESIETSGSVNIVHRQSMSKRNVKMWSLIKIALLLLYCTGFYKTLQKRKKTYNYRIKKTWLFKLCPPPTANTNWLVNSQTIRIYYWQIQYWRQMTATGFTNTFDYIRGLGGLDREVERSVAEINKHMVGLSSTAFYV